MTVTTPHDLVIAPRNVRFGKHEGRSRLWMGGNTFATAWHNALSVVFPAGETFFIEVMQPFRNAAPQPLSEQIAAFVRQEAFHTREHNVFNDRLKAEGYDLSETEAWMEATLAKARARHPVVQLSVTTALEHFTAIFAHLTLKHPEIYAGTSDEARGLWMWHAIEEVEHKGVAYDTFMHVTRTMWAGNRWLMRNLVFLQVTWAFLTRRWGETLRLLEQDDIVGLRARFGLFAYLWLYPGILRRVSLSWAAYLAPSFHPWQRDDRNLIADAQRRYGLTPENGWSR